MSLEGRVALVTGASRGIGVGIAKCMARDGAAVVANYNRSEESAREVVKDIESSGGKAIAIKADVGDYDQVKSMVEQTIDELGKCDILVSNAGISGPFKPVIDLPPDEFWEVIDNHLMGAFNCARNVIPYMREYERGDVQFISSRSTDMLAPNESPYNCAKNGMDIMAKGVAKEERYNGIRVNCINPGLVVSDMTSESVPKSMGVADISEVDPVMPFGRMIRPEDIGNLCAFLASEEGSHISGEVIYVRGGVGAEPPSHYLAGKRTYSER